jgi:PAS domain-containing protein
VEIAVLNQDGIIVMTNESWQRSARENTAPGLTEAGAGVNYLDVWRAAAGKSADGSREVLAALEEILADKRREFVFEYPCDSGAARRWFLLQANAMNRPAGWVVVVHSDITGRKELEGHLWDQQERFRVAPQNSPVVVFNQDRELRYTWINAPVLSWAIQDHIGRTDMEIHGGVEGERLTAIKSAVLETGVTTRAETTVTFRGAS